MEAANQEAIGRILAGEPVLTGVKPAGELLDRPLVFAGLIILAIMGVILYAIFAVIEQRMTFWAQTRPEDVG